jgi:DNA-binding MarR family transcriptional regulator
VTEPRHEQLDAAKPEREVLRAVADLVIGMSRLLTGLAKLPPFRAANFTVADWVALSILAKGSPKNNRQLANNLGVTRQRANQIKTSLEQARLISAVQSTEDARQNVLTVTARGHAHLKEINAELQAALKSSLKGRERAIARANNGIRVLVRSIRGSGEIDKLRPSRRKDARRQLTKMSRPDS